MKILVPVDGSKYSAEAVDFLASRTTLIGDEPQIELLNVQTSIPVRAARLVGKIAIDSYHAAEGDRVLKPALRALTRAGLVATGTVRVGHAGEEIAAAARRDKVDLILMGSHGHGALAGMVLGSVTQSVLARTHKPVLVLRARGAPKGDSLRVGIALDGSRFGRLAARYVLKHRGLFGATPRIELVHAVPDFAGAVMPDMAGIALPAFSAEDIRTMQRKAFEVAVGPVRALFAKEGVSVTEVCLSGPAGNALSAYARRRKLDVLVMGSHGYGLFRSAVLGSVATRVAAHCTTPLLLVRGR